MNATDDKAPMRLDDVSAVRFAEPDVRVVADEVIAAPFADLAASYYGFWNNANPSLLLATVSSDYIDRTLPPGRRQGPGGLIDAATAFFDAFPDGRVQVLQQMLVGDRIISHLRVTGSFNGLRHGLSGKGQAIDYLATDIMRVANNLIVENSHVEDHETLYRQLAA